MSHRQNITRLKVVYGALEELASEVVFVGGATVSLYADRPYSDSRPTDDVDILVELLSYKSYAAIDEKLRTKGFVNDVQSGIICRYIVKGIIVDVMPTADAALGFSNKWYPEAFTRSKEMLIDKGIRIKIFDPVYFLAVKMEAFKGRGENEGRFSTDFEDIVFLLNKRNAIWQELQQSPENVKQYLKETFNQLLGESYFDEWISCHIDFDEQKRVGFITGSLKEFIDTKYK
jgi:predicted nucleotidyltransferase